MSPRPAATRHDVPARAFLGAAARMIDEVLAPTPPAATVDRRAWKYPAALEWLRIEDVIRVAQSSGQPGVSRRAFHNRWPAKEDFIRDAVIYALLYQDDPDPNPARRSRELAGVSTASSVADAIIQLANGLIDILLSDPRSYLLIHIGPLLDQHPQLRDDVIADMLRNRAPWYEGYGYLLSELGLTLRPDWTVERAGLALQAMLDGFIFRGRIQQEDVGAARWQGASLFADTVIAFTLGVLDVGRDELTARQALDAAVTHHGGA